ncbi:MAG: glucose-6-phosphate isomerase, partial [Rhodoferax sp.]
MSPISCDQTPAWRALQAAFDAPGRSFDLRAGFAADADRFQAFSQSAPHVFADLSKNLIDSATEHLLFELARQTGLEQHRDAMFAGAAINGTEQRAVMHWLLRQPALAPAAGQLAGESAAVRTVLDAMLE